MVRKIPAYWRAVAPIVCSPTVDQTVDEVSASQLSMRCGYGSASAAPAQPITGESLRIVLGSNPQASQIPLVYGFGRYGYDFGLAMTIEQNVMKFDTHTDAVKT